MKVIVGVCFLPYICIVLVKEHSHTQFNSSSYGGAPFGDPLLFPLECFCQTSETGFLVDKRKVFACLFHNMHDLIEADPMKSVCV